MKRRMSGKRTSWRMTSGTSLTMNGTMKTTARSRRTTTGTRQRGGAKTRRRL
jgi:hypothetical protein